MTTIFTITFTLCLLWGAASLLKFMLKHSVGIFFACLCIFTFLALTA